VQIRPANPADLDSIATVWHGGWHAAHAAIADPRLTAARTEVSFRARLNDLWPDCWVIEAEGAIRGMVVLEGEEVGHLFLDPAWRGRGLGRRLLAHAEAILARRGLLVARLDCARDNAAGAAFYRREGWVEQTLFDKVFEINGAMITAPTRIFAKDISGGDRLVAIRRAELQVATAWPALHTAWDGDWLIRMSDGFTGRGNSAAPMSHDETGGTARLQRAVAAFRRQGITPTIRLSPLAPPRMDLDLLAAGWRLHHASIVLAGSVAAAAADPAVTITPAVSDAWMTDCVAIGGCPAEHQGTMTRMLTAMIPEVGYLHLVEDGRLAAIAIAVMTEDTVNLFDVAADPTRRRRGYGRRIVETAMAWGRARGATRALLQVAAGNDPAIALYHRLGYQEIYRYHYRVLD
jgi:ribosomal protein S18 acetylase RimI-like enzyme